MVTGGTIANINGREAEWIVEQIIADSGYEVVKYSDYHSSKRKTALYDSVDKLLVKNVPYYNIYGLLGKTEFVAYDRTNDRQIRIEVKFQKSHGSVDEKYPFMYLNAVFGYEENEVIFIVDGDGYRKGARDWLVMAAESQMFFDESALRSKKITVMSISEFSDFVRRGFRYEP